MAVKFNCLQLLPLLPCKIESILCVAGITNYDEYSLVRDIGEEKKEETMGTLKRDKTLLRDDKKMEKLKQKLHTDDECMRSTHPHTVFNA